MYSTKNYIQSPGINNNGKECVKNKHIYVHNRVTLLYSRNWHNIINQLRCCCCSLIIKLCPALCDPMDCSSQALLCVGFILQARTQEWISFSFSRESSCPRDWTHVSCIASGFFTIWAIREALIWQFTLFFFGLNPQNLVCILYLQHISIQVIHNHVWASGYCIE